MMNNMGDLMKKAQQMQEQMQKAQATTNHVLNKIERERKRAKQTP